MLSILQKDVFFYFYVLHISVYFFKEKELGVFIDDTLISKSISGKCYVWCDAINHK